MKIDEADPNSYIPEVYAYQVFKQNFIDNGHAVPPSEAIATLVLSSGIRMLAEQIEASNVQQSGSLPIIGGG